MILAQIHNCEFGEITHFRRNQSNHSYCYAMRDFSILSTSKLLKKESVVEEDYFNSSKSSTHTHTQWFSFICVWVCVFVRNSTITLHKTMWCLLFQLCFVLFSFIFVLWRMFVTRYKGKGCLFLISKLYYSLFYCFASSHFVSNRNNNITFFFAVWSCWYLMFFSPTNRSFLENKHFSIAWRIWNQTHNMKWESLILLM
jgi:hypothetical protein